MTAPLVHTRPWLLALVLLAGLGAAQVPAPGAQGTPAVPASRVVHISWMIHVDPSPWDTPAFFDHGCFILDQMADLVEAHGGLMCVATSRPFLDGCVAFGNGPAKPGSLGDLASRGHEIAYHQHDGDLSADTALIRQLILPYTSERWPQHIEGGSPFQDLVALGYRSGPGCGKDRASQLFGHSMHPYRPVEGECYAQDPAGPLINIGGGATDGAGQASDSLDEMLTALEYALDRRRPDKLTLVNLTTTHPDSWIHASPAEVVADFQVLDAWMTLALDPLLLSGAVAWANPAEKADMFERWEQYGGDNSDMFPAPDVTDPDWSWLDSSNAPLASDRVDELLLDSQGRLWVGSGDEVGGLAVLDGGTWTTYTSATSPLAADRITSLAEGPGGELWIATFASGPGTSTALQRFDGVTWTTFNASNSPIPDPFLFEVAVDPAGVVWVGGRDGLYRYGGAGWASYTADTSPLPDRQTGVTDIEAPNATELYVALRTGGVLHLEHQGDALPLNDTWTFHDRSTVGAALASDTIHAVALHPGGALYAGTLRGLSVLDGSTWTGYSAADSDLGYDQICDIDFDAQGRVWLATFGGGLVRFDPAAGTFENFDIPDGTVHGRFNNTVQVGSAGVFGASLRAGGISVYTGS